MYTLNLIPKKTTPVIVSCSEGDQILRAFQFKIMDGESNWSIDCDSLSIIENILDAIKSEAMQQNMYLIMSKQMTEAKDEPCTGG